MLLALGIQLFIVAPWYYLRFVKSEIEPELECVALGSHIGISICAWVLHLTRSSNVLREEN